MRKVMFSVVAVLAFGSFAIANNEEVENTTTSRPDGVVVEVVTEVEADEALYCKVTWPNGTSYECWFCKCSDLPQPPAQIANIQ
jgi:hypothetical protein